MREDMYEVIIERPRRGGTKGSSAKTGRAPQRTKDDFEAAPTKEPLRDRRQRTKSLNENLAPLFRFLRKNVGRPWNKVFSEVCDQISSQTGVQKHVRDHVVSYVELDVVLVDGVPHKVGSYGKGFQPIYNENTTYGRLYVCPKTGLLKEAKPTKKKKTVPATVIHRLSNEQTAICVRGQWFLCEMRGFIGNFALGSASVLHDDAIFGKSYEADLNNFYGKYQRAVTTRPMKKKEIAYAMTCPIATK